MTNDDAVERAALLDALMQAVRTRAAADRSFRHVVGPLPEDLAYLAAALRRDAQAWRTNRAFHAVHVPSLLAVLSMLEDIDAMASVTEADRDRIDTALHRACRLATEARERVERTVLDAAQTELDVLAGYARPPAEPLRKPSLAERSWAGLRSAPTDLMAAARDGATALPGALGALRDGAAPAALASRLTALPTLASNLRRTLSGTLSDSVVKPVEMRLQAGGTALKYGLGTGLGVGVACAVLFPPLLPLSAGGAVLGAMRGWRSQMDAAQALQGAARDERIAALRAEREAALLQLTNGAAAVQMESEALSLTLDVEMGEADAVVLRGAHSGRRWSELSVGEQADVASLAAQGADTLIQLLRHGADGA